jgi:hypothetical protein
LAVNRTPLVEVQEMEHLKDLVPLLQTVLWISAIFALLYIFRPEIKLLRENLKQRIESGGAIEIGPIKIGELKKEISSVKVKLDETNDRISKLFLITMSEDMYVNLKKLAQKSGFGKYEMNGGLERELFHLRDIGYIEVPYVRNIPKAGNNLSDHVKITKAGKQFVELRENITEEIDQPI